ncbi:MAG: tRNA guanosine(15) transglycosylase TgtA [Candidatus Aenigmarchaeota archaeon]|nr:tRNA guanosine(15) transglycosylase TgtA [Candidatus Aenigmarchaeota archaeon]
MVKLLTRDGMGRILKIRTKSGDFLTPTFFPVINPNKQIIAPKEIKEKFGWDVIITNSYIIWRTEKWREKALSHGLHRTLDFDGVIFTDSGAYQIWQYGNVEISNREIVEFQQRIGSDIATFLDIPMPHTIPISQAKKGVKLTIERAKECKELTEGSKTLWIATVQGSVYRDLVKKCARELASLGFDYYGCGSLKIATDEWRFKEQIDYLMTSHQHLPVGKPKHLWGIGHPAVFTLFVALGWDTFDSASYALYAEDGRYMTTEGTLRIDEMEELPCNCPVCSKYDIEEIKKMEKEERVKLIAEHNLWVMFTEIKRIREAIREGSLWELVQQRVRAHPRLQEALFYSLKKYGDYAELFDPVTKKSAFFYSGPESNYRPEVRRAVRWLKRVKKAKRYFFKKPWGKVPLGLKIRLPLRPIDVSR